jgi:hypothetical protein
VNTSEPTQTCLNCKEVYAQKSHFCPNCGQNSKVSIITFKEALSDFLASLVAFDSKVFNTIPRLLFYPGRLTKEYLEGKRASQLPPFRLYLFLSIILILLLSLVMKDEKALFNVDPEESQSVMDSLNQAFQTEFFDDIDSLKQSNDSSSKNDFNIQIGGKDQEIMPLLEAANDLLDQGLSVEQIEDSILIAQPFFKRLVVKQTLKFKDQKGRGILHVLLKTSSYAMLIFLPLFALILKLLYVRRNRFYIEHVIFTLHFFSFIFFMLIFFVLINLLPVRLPGWILLFLILVYLFLSMHKVYQQSWKKTLLKLAGLMTATIIFIGPLLMILVSLVSFFFY